ncbi:MAG: sugar ABC transporter ATP-binding protein [Acidobacteriota bacterium]
MAEAVLLRATNINKSYAGVQALSQAAFELRKGEVHALIGENGAGKTTLIKIITGAILPDSGELEVDGQIITHHSPGHAKTIGIAAIYQQPALFPELTVTENIALGLEATKLWQPVNWSERQRLAENLLAEVGAKFDTQMTAGELSMPQQQLVEIARAIGANARVLILDEPTASLSEADTQNLFQVIRKLREQGVGMIYISHRLEELPLIADRVTVLRDGRTIDTRVMAEVNRQALIQLMVGRELTVVFPKQPVELGETVLELRGLGCKSSGIANINLSIRAGEIVGLAGLVGAGRTELARAIFGLTPNPAGEILLKGESVKITSPAEAIKAGIAYLPEDRRQHGVILDMPVAANVTLASLNKFSRLRGFDFQREKQLATEYTHRLNIKTPSVFSPVANLSGGNQQKVALSRWLAIKPAVLILDEPTQGIDIGAKSEIHKLMGELAGQGVAILMISSELPEILGMSDRIAVMHAGTIVEVLSRTDATQEKILALALGHKT